MGGKIAAIFVIIVILGVGLYVLNSGVLSKSATSLGTLFSSSSTGSFFSPSGGNGPAIPPAATPGGANYPTTTGTAGGTGAGAIPPGYSQSDLSPYYGKLHFGTATGGSFGQISIFAYLPAGESVDVTGWQIRTNRGGEFIPQAVNFYQPFGTTPETDIKLTDGDRLYIFPNSAPTNLRLNECTGYLNTANQYNPALPQACPSPNFEEIQGFTGACQNFIQTIGACQAADPNDVRVPRNDYQCQDYIANHFNYRSCVDLHQRDKNFFSHEVRVWAGGNPIDQFHDRVMLLDGNGKLVDYYTF